MAIDKREDAGQFYPGGSVVPRGPVTPGGGTPADYAEIREKAKAGAAHAAETGNPHATTAEQVGFRVVELVVEGDAKKLYLMSNGERTTERVTSYAELLTMAKRGLVRLYYNAVGSTGRKALYTAHMVDDNGTPAMRFDATGTLGESVYTRSIALTKSGTDGISVTIGALTEIAKSADVPTVTTTIEKTEFGKAADAAAVKTALEEKLDKVNPTVKGVAYSDSANRAATLTVSGGDREMLGRFSEGGEIDVKGGTLGGKIKVRKTENPLAAEDDSATVIVEDAAGAIAVEIRGGASRGGAANRAASIKLIGLNGGKEILLQSKGQGTYPPGEKGASITIGGVEVALVTDIATATKLTPVYGEWVTSGDFEVVYKGGGWFFDYGEESYSALLSTDPNAVSLEYDDDSATRSIVGYKLGAKTAETDPTLNGMSVDDITRVAEAAVDDKLPIALEAKTANFTAEDGKRYTVASMPATLSVTLPSYTGDAAKVAHIFEARFDGAALAADASVTFAGGTATTMDTDCGTVKAGKIALMSAFWNGATWDVSWKNQG